MEGNENQKKESRPRQSKRLKATISSFWLRGSNSATTQQTQGPSRKHLWNFTHGARARILHPPQPPSLDGQHLDKILSFCVGVLVSRSCCCSVNRNLRNVCRKVWRNLNAFLCANISLYPRSDSDSSAPPRRAAFQLTMNMP